MKIILLGLPGSGKGTQAKMLARQLNIPPISTGDIFRKAYKEQTELGLLAHQYMSKGELVPDELTVGIAIRRLSDPDCDNGYVLDGFPRNLYQAYTLNKHLDSQSKQIDKVVFIEVDEGVLLNRLTGRRVCSGCSETFHVESHPPKIANQCDLCASPLIQRDDDQETTVKERLAVNGALTEQLVYYYSSHGILMRINGLNTIEEVSLEILNAL